MQLHLLLHAMICKVSKVMIESRVFYTLTILYDLVYFYFAILNIFIFTLVYNAVDLEGLYTLGTVVIDYRGFRVTAQSIIPGILEREQEQSVVYGSIDFGKSVVTHPKYMDFLQKAGSQLKILPHSVINDKNEEVLHY